MRWNLRLAAAQRDIWKASELQRMLAEAGLVISAGKMSNLWSGQPVTIRLDDLEVICEVLGCEPGDLLIREPVKFRRGEQADDDARAAGGRRSGDPTPTHRTFRASRCERARPPPGSSRRQRPRASRLRSCDHCLALGMLTERLCKACRSFASNHPAGTCATCGRDLPADAGVCRPCRKQASLIAGPAEQDGAGPVRRGCHRAPVAVSLRSAGRHGQRAYGCPALGSSATADDPAPARLGPAAALRCAARPVPCQRRAPAPRPRPG